MNKKIAEDYVFIIRTLKTKSILDKTNYTFFNWHLTEYYQNEIPELKDLDFSPYVNDDYYNSDERPPSINFNVAKQIFNVICSNDVLYEEIKFRLRDSSNCWQCGAEPIDQKKYHELYNKGRTPMCNNCYDKLANMLDELEFNIKVTERAKENINYILSNKQSKQNKNCYIATLVYEDINHPKVNFLREFRDNQMSKSRIGRIFISFYYKYAPKWVEILKGKNKLNSLIRFALDRLINLLTVLKK